MSAMLARLRALFVPAPELDPGREMRRVAALGMAIIVVGVLGLAVWAATAPLSGAIIAPGFVKVDMNRKVVQHQEGGMVKEVRVRDGERVQRGQTLLVLEDLRVDAALGMLRQQLDSERAKTARLESERSLAPRVNFPKDMDPQREPKVAELIDRETALFRARREALEGQIAVLRRQIAQTEEEARALADQIRAEERAIKLQREELEVNERLVRENFVQRTRILALQRSVAEYEARHAEHRAELSKTRQRTAELELRILSMRNGYVQAATDELKESSGRMFDLQERLRPSRDASERQVVTAPIAGEVVGLRVFSSGAVVGPREVLLEVVPDEKILIIEARIRPEDINHVRAGTLADVRLTAFKQRTTPLVEGKVTYVSGDRLVENVPGGSVPYYAVHINVPAAALEPGNQRLQAGMPAEVFFRTDQRTALDYLLAPITAYFRRGMREPL